MEASRARLIEDGPDLPATTGAILEHQRHLALVPDQLEKLGETAIGDVEVEASSASAQRGQFIGDRNRELHIVATQLRRLGGRVLTRGRLV